MGHVTLCNNVYIVMLYWWNMGFTLPLQHVLYYIINVIFAGSLI